MAALCSRIYKTRLNSTLEHNFKGETPHTLGESYKDYPTPLSRFS